MKFLTCALLCMLACGSPQPAPVAPPLSGSAAAPEAPPVATPVAIAFVIEGWEMWVGNDQIPDIDEREQYQGALQPFKEAFGRLKLTDFPAGSQAAVVTYTDRATVRQPMQPIDKLTPAAFGEQKDYFGTIDRDLVSGVTAGLDELAKAKNARRILVVIGDGNDSHPSTAKAALGELAKRAAAEKVEVVSLRYLGPLSSPSSNVSAFDPATLTINSIAGITDQLDFLFTRLKKPPVAAASTTAIKAPLVVAFLVNGSEVWMGNDDVEPQDSPARYVGALKPMRAAFEKAALTGFPAGSVAMLITYDSATKVRVPPMAIENFGARALGAQGDYHGGFGTELVSGVTGAFTELLKIDAARRVVVVIGDGNDTNNDTAKTQLQGLALRAAEYHIEVHALVFKGQLSEPGTVVTALVPNAETAASADDLTAKLVTLFSTLRKK
ncbi:MAG TPA: hypothetical protein VMZ53_10900 [Kofleriaceae bacterium]|nr:hypothetical protein [Kofleriaceae bacterium]